MIVFQHAGESGRTGMTPRSKGRQPSVVTRRPVCVTFYQSAIYPQNGSAWIGVGCDNTSEPLTELRPVPVLLPERPTDRGEFAWFSFDGRWGQKEQRPDRPADQDPVG